MKTFLGIVLEVSMERDEILGLMRNMRNFREVFDDVTITASIFGYDSDPRELWEIEEVKIFANRLMELGFISYLDSMPDPADGPTHPLTAVDIWLLAHGKLASLVDINVNEFEVVLQLSNEIAEKTLDNSST